MEIRDFVAGLQDIKLENCFNPYTMIDNRVDLENAHEIRSKNLICYLTYLKEQEPKQIWIGEALGYRGGKCSGIPFTDTQMIVQKQYNNCDFDLPTKKVITEITAQKVHEVMDMGSKLPLLWNIFPFHPHKENNSQSNRSPKSCELKIGYEIFKELATIFQDVELISIGRKAQNTLHKYNISSKYIRHPSRGGAKLFRNQILKIYKS